MLNWVRTETPKRVVMVTECSMSDNVAVGSPDTEFIRPCNLCPYMKKITLEGIRDALRDMKHEVIVPDDIAQGARRAVDRMLALG